MPTATTVFFENQGLMDEPTPENEKVWDSLLRIGRGFVNITNPQDYGLLPGHRGRCRPVFGGHVSPTTLSCKSVCIRLGKKWSNRVERLRCVKSTGSQSERCGSQCQIQRRGTVAMHTCTITRSIVLRFLLRASCAQRI